jgi:hypothetical protein
LSWWAGCGRQPKLFGYKGFHAIVNVASPQTAWW